MHCQTVVLTAVVLSLALAGCITGPALARTHPTRPAAKTVGAPTHDPALPPYARAGEAAPAAPEPPGDGPPPGLTGELAKWIAATDDNGALPFMIVDKRGARAYAFDAAGGFLGSAPVLLGMARGDDSAPEIRGLKLAQISAEQRTTPAGRFVTQWGPSDRHGTMLWVDLVDAISMHPVMSVSASEHRAQRIRSADPNDHRISYGCINLPKPFYDNVVLTALEGGNAIVYVMPDTKPIAVVFPAFAAAGPASPPITSIPRTASSVDAPDRIRGAQRTRVQTASDRRWMDPSR
jgi:hypothetical protein